VGPADKDLPAQSPDAAGAVKLPVEQARVQMLRMLAASSSDVARAAALLIQQSAPTASAGDEQATCASAACPKAVSVVEQASGTQPRTGATSFRDQLARQALASHSPHIYAIAFEACQAPRTDKSVVDACQMLSADQWARLDPNNAIPWLHVANEAKARGDLAAVNEAMYRISKAHTSDMPWTALPSLAAKHLPADAPALTKAAITSQLMEVASHSVPRHQTATQYCAAARPNDANRQQVCSAIAEVLTTKGTSLVDLSVGIAVAEYAGWPAERVAALRQERDAMEQVGASMPRTVQDKVNCTVIQKHAELIDELGKHGEVGTMRRHIQRSGLTVAELAQRTQEARSKAAAQRAAAAASAPATTGGVLTSAR
jgi:hypothetical protein